MQTFVYGNHIYHTDVCLTALRPRYQRMLESILLPIMFNRSFYSFQLVLACVLVIFPYDVGRFDYFLLVLLSSLTSAVSRELIFLCSSRPSMTVTAQTSPDVNSDPFLLENPLEAGPVEDPDDPLDPSFFDVVDSLEGGTNDSPDLYSVLGVPRDADIATIRTAYKRLSLLLHPDRHTSSSTGDSNSVPNRLVVADAEAAFGRVSTAYAVLSDPAKRRIYDAYGHEGLQVQGWEITGCEKSAPEMRLEYLMLKQKAKAEKQLQLTQPSSEFALGLDLTDVFDRYLEEPIEERTVRPKPSVNQLTLAQSVTAGLTTRNAVTLAGQVTAHNGLGVGTWMLMWRHHCGKRSLLSFTTIDSEVSYGRGGRGLGAGVRLRRAFGDRFVGNLGFSLNSAGSQAQSRISLIPGISTGWHIQLLPRTQARIEWRWNLDPGLSAEVLWSSEGDEYAVRLSTRLSAIGRAGVALRLEKTVLWSWLNPPRGSGAGKGEETHSWNSTPDWAKDDEEELEIHSGKHGRIFGSVDVNTVDLVELTVGAQCSVSLYSRLSGSLSFSFQRGVNLRISLLRGTQSYSLPIILSEQPNRVAAGYGFVVPLLLFAAFRTLVYEPYLNRQLERAQVSRRAKLRNELLRRRREALSTQELMKHTANRIRESEAAVGGLVIVQATFGYIPPVDSEQKLSDAGGPLNFDVTIPLQALVEQNQLRLPPGRWSDIQGFYDPCVGIVRLPGQKGVLRQLHVVYTFHNTPHEVIADESQGLAIPLAKHKIETL
ncbi:DnaJ domain protein [Opisthorchis viverrini]|uniref:DnaJ domain protein n=1 Tax=Opisthorchis viverrini TaxID=6198 RepID=A0A1S8X5M2_OPIVI|nr:DnaJ domain protein [Opisthorchis viverrini]